MAPAVISPDATGEGGLYAPTVSDVPVPASTRQTSLELTVNGTPVSIADRAQSLMSLLREDLQLRSVKDGCSPQGQCGCCTVLVDGKPRVACVTPARRVRGRHITTIEGLDESTRSAWGDAFCAAGASQCGFCTPGIVMRLQSLSGPDDPADTEPAGGAARSEQVDQALLAHLCRCTGWQTIHEAWDLVRRGEASPEGRDLDAAGRRATLEGRANQRVAPEIALGHGGFVADTAPEYALIALADADGNWQVSESLDEARAMAGKVQGRRTTISHGWPLNLPEGKWATTLRTTWVEPGYVEPDAAWCEPGAEPVAAAANGGAFGAKNASNEFSIELARVSRELADKHGRAVLVLASREDVTRRGAKRPPVAGGMNADGSGVLRVVRTPGIADIIAAVAPGLTVEEVDVAGPPTSSLVRAAGWAEALVLAAGATGVVGQAGMVEAPNGSRATATINLDNPAQPVISIHVACGDPLDEIVVRSYCIGAAHMAWSWLTSEALTVDAEGVVHDLTVRSFGILRAVDTPLVEVAIEASDNEPVNGSDVVFAAVAASGWLARGCPPDLPAG